jgi:hypothetical protein
MQDKNTQVRETIGKNFGAAIDMLAETIRLCPDTLWQRKDRFYYMAYHTTIFLDYYLSIPSRDFHAPLAYTLVEPDHLPEGAVDDVIPDQVYSRPEMLAWLQSTRMKCRSLILSSDDNRLAERWIRDDELDLHLGCPSLVKDYSILEILFYNLRHVQHHVAQLNTMLRSEAGIAADWISQAD